MILVFDRPTPGSGHLCDKCTYQKVLSGPGWEKQTCGYNSKPIPGMVSICSYYSSKDIKWGAPQEIENAAYYKVVFMGQIFWVRKEDEYIFDDLHHEDKLEFLKKVAL